MFQDSHILYFSYGSNMAVERLGARLRSAEKIDLALLTEHLLKFHKVSRMDNSAKCDAFFTGEVDDLVYGVLYAIKRDELKQLDKIEGVGSGYDRKQVRIRTNGGDTLEAETYVATRIDPALQPLDWYKEHVLRGARAGGLPADYINSMIEAVEAIIDQDEERKRRELAVYTQSPQRD